MALYGYNFNAYNTPDQLVARGWLHYVGNGGLVSETPGIADTTVKESWNTKSWHISTDQYNGLVAPLLPNAVDKLRIKWDVTLGVLGSVNKLFIFAPNLSIQGSIFISSTGDILVYSGDGSTLLAAFAAGCVVNTAYNIEVEYYINATTNASGTVKVYMQGVQLESTDGNMTTTGNTKGSSTYATIQSAGVQSGIGTSRGSLYWHDLIMADGDDVSVVIGNDAVISGAIDSVVNNNGYEAVGAVTDIPTILNNSPPNPAQYIEAAASGSTISLRLAAPPTTYDATYFKAVAVRSYALKNGSGDCTLRVDLSLNGTLHTGTAAALSTAYTGQTVSVTGATTSTLIAGAVVTLTKTV